MNKIIQGNCLEIMQSMEDKSIDHTFTSPPYNRKRNDKYKFYDDTLVDYYGFIKNSIEECLRVSRGYVIFNIQKNYYNKVDVFRLFGNFAEQIQEIIIWEKKNPMPASGNSITNAYEFFIVLGDKSLKSNTTYTKNVIQTSVNGKMPKTHKAVMKQEVSDWFIKNFTKENETILDLFAGTGTTAISCIEKNRKYILIEKEAEYIKIAEARINAWEKEKQKKLV